MKQIDLLLRNLIPKNCKKPFIRKRNYQYHSVSDLAFGDIVKLQIAHNFYL